MPRSAASGSRVRSAWPAVGSSIVLRSLVPAEPKPNRSRVPAAAFRYLGVPMFGVSFLAAACLPSASPSRALVAAPPFGFPGARAPGGSGAKMSAGGSAAAGWRLLWPGASGTASSKEAAAKRPVARKLMQRYRVFQILANFLGLFSIATLRKTLSF